MFIELNSLGIGGLAFTLGVYYKLAPYTLDTYKLNVLQPKRCKSRYEVHQ